MNRLDTDYMVILHSGNAFHVLEKANCKFPLRQEKAELPIYNVEELINVMTIGEGRHPEEPVIPFTKEENDIFFNQSQKHCFSMETY